MLQNVPSSTLRSLSALLKLASALDPDKLHDIIEKLKGMLSHEEFFNTTSEKDPLTFNNKGIDKVMSIGGNIGGNSLRETLMLIDKAIDIAATDPDSNVIPIRNYLRRTLRTRPGWWTKASFSGLSFDQARSRALKYCIEPFLAALVAVTETKHELEPVI